VVEDAAGVVAGVADSLAAEPGAAPVPVPVPDPGTFGAVDAELAVAAVGFPVAFAELADAAVVAASVAFDGPSSAPANLHVVATTIIAATNALLRHLKHSELNRSLIPLLPPTKLSKAARSHQAVAVHINIIAN
jgi:hypothetical protein